MFEQDVNMNSGTRLFTFVAIGNELVAIIYDARLAVDCHTYLRIGRFQVRLG